MALFAIFHSFLELHLQWMLLSLCLTARVLFNKAVGNCRERPIGQLNWYGSEDAIINIVQICRCMVFEENSAF
ncbi:hypothetical protein BRADI_1g48056v3 [Brachypodium distachyon]|uniref:Secreted protein n=1 Tax=Brachypodium distachyon TaxID=15368 RepID=A0A2K2DQ77_BRADI|nr:hypothetical protein BRADI_1g48056v3 [Brachypodium distachyon]